MDGLIRKSTDDDVESIHQWLKEQCSDSSCESLYVNWSLTLQAHKEGKLIVYIEPQSNEPVAYQWGDLVQPGILEVKKDKRNHGIGAKLVRHCIQNAIEQNICALHIQCKPSSSIPFWERIGFVIYNSSSNKAYKILEKDLALPGNAMNIPVCIRFYPECRNWDENTTPIETFNQTAVQTPDDVIHLKRRICVFNSLDIWKNDVVVEIVVDGERL